MHDEQQKLPAILLSPRGPYRVGDSFVASWTLTNFADHDLPGASLAFDLPASVDPVLANSTIAGARGESIAGAFSPDGYALGTVRRGDSVSAMLELRFAREATSPQALSVTLGVDGSAVYASEPVELALRARALLAFAEPPGAFDVESDGRRLGVSFTLENVGEMRAERLELSVPPPPGYVFSRVRLPGGSAPVTGKEPFRLPEIARGESLDVVLEFEARGVELSPHVVIEGLRIAYSGGHLYADPTTVRLDNGEVRLEGSLGAAATTVEPGSVIRLDLTVSNPGASDAPGVAVAFVLPPELGYCPGTIAVNGGSDPRRDEPRAIPVGTVLGRSRTTVSLYATVVSPLAHDARLVVGASVDGARVADLDLIVKSEPSFPANATCFELDGPPVVGAGETRTLRIRAANVGTADAQGVRIRVVSPQLVIERAAVVLSSGARESVGMKPTVSREGIACSIADLGTVAARDIKTLEVEVRAPDHFSDGDTFALRADVRYAGGKEFDIGAIAIVGRCRPSIDVSESGLCAQRPDPLRVGGVRAYTLRVKNAGLAPARGVTVSLNLPGMLAIEAVNGEPVRSDVVTIREIPAGAAVEVPIALRLVESVDGGAEITLVPIVAGESISSIPLAPVRVRTAGQAFLDEFAIELDRRERDVVATLRFRNVGDAVAQHVEVCALDLPTAYVLESTRLGDVAMPDFGGASLLRRGIMLSPVLPGRDVALSYRMSEADADGARVAFVVRSRSQDEILPEPAIYRSPNAKRAEPDFTALRNLRAEVPRFTNDFSARDLGGPRTGNGRHPVPASAGTSEAVVVDAGPPLAQAVAAAVEATMLAGAVATAPRAYGLVGYLTLDAAQIERVRGVAETALAIPALGTYRHFFAMRALVPRDLLGASASVAAQWATVHDRARADLGAPFQAAAMPGFEAGIAWANQFQDATSAEAAGRAIAAIRQAASENEPYDDEPIPSDQLRGPIGHDFESYLASMAEPSGNVLNLILAEAIPCESPRDPLLSKSLKRYRERLKLLFAALLYQNPNARHERMLSGLDVELDDTLAAIVDRLRDPRWM
jgi:uncharacterized repeat protein (TIGR01451 family)